MSLYSHIKSIIEEKINDKTTVIAIHGASSSGKSTMGRSLKKILSQFLKVSLISLDTFYKDFTGEDITKYDLDNPDAIEWKNVHQVLSAYHNEEEKIPYWYRDFNSYRSYGPFFKENVKPQIIIVEGMLALNLFSEYEFTGFSAIDPSKGSITRNNIKYPNFNVLKIKLNMCKSRMKHVKLIRDVKERGSKTEVASQQFETQVWPGTEKWIEHEIFSEADFILVHGTFNKIGYKTLLEAISEAFTGIATFENCITTQIDTIPCEGDCYIKHANGFIILDSHISS
ncbi:Armadillo/beta-Catenin/plakoglobin [Pseudoloma neurophilia]|uniref:Armadillo/beta-Catenin/plakoglobin n=1 Tax=Pseudoloma neurophilia TaxID=146866 RepID=A0A0R0M623_9MICR|nr:Armadillo/beta-Catenin/plakoglobin [Pseudoloma neurophilia]